MILREYQKAAVDKIRACIKNGHRRPLLQLPTGGGKSLIFGKIIQSIVNNGKKVLWIVHRRNLVFQMQETLKSFFYVVLV
jgi:superfamily II DNA or RNA helicase